MCGGGTLPLLATASINANCPCVSSPVARKVISQPLYQTERSRDCRPLLNAMDSVGFIPAAPGAAPEELFLRSMICRVIELLSFGASVNDCNLADRSVTLRASCLPKGGNPVVEGNVGI